uniref:2Fe-2S ferredoxin n=1 Tax=Compsopogon caeruleus TaxID=31354 RepID=A0A7S1XC96_9RHOD|mmetsp:Transcript_15995/g.32141  ORF Transcript_15995/g.32141 Transcript_15995/m.32141 type:complete len:166 (+) Transcript_15995:245-742(+)
MRGVQVVKAASALAAGLTVGTRWMLPGWHGVRGWKGCTTWVDGSKDRGTVDISFVDREGGVMQIAAPLGKSLLEVAHSNSVDLEGACEGSLACSTCHVYLDEISYGKLSEPTDDENDMLDLAFGLSETSRLGCQVKVSKDLAGMTVRLPPATRNMAVDGYVPKPH